MADEIIEPILQPTAQGINKELINDVTFLKNAAINFLTLMGIANQAIVHIDNLQNTKASLDEIYKNMKKDTQYTRSAIAAQFAFETAINQFLGRTILLLYVTTDGQTLYADEETAATIYALATKHGEGRGNVRMTNARQTKYLTNLEDVIQKIDATYKQTLMQRQANYKPIRDEVVVRWNNNHGLNEYWSQRKPDTFYWNKTSRDHPQWEWSAKINRGHINETYAYLIWNDKEENTILKSVNEQAVAAYWNYMTAHNILNSTAGIVEGDISFFINDAIQFAVKSGAKFSTAAIGSYIDVAYQIAYGSIQVDKYMVETLLKNLSTYSHNVRNKSLEEAEKALRQAINSTGGIVT